jgi:hypothetical protein
MQQERRGTTRPAGPNKIRAAGGCRRPSCKRFAVKPCDWILVKGRFGRACLVGQVGWLARWEPDRSPPFAPLTGSAVGEGESIAEYGSKQHANVDPRLCSRDRLPTSHVRPKPSPPGDAAPALPAIPASGRPGLAGRPGASRSPHAPITSARRANGTMKTLPLPPCVPVAASQPKGRGALFSEALQVPWDSSGASRPQNDRGTVSHPNRRPTKNFVILREAQLSEGSHST